MSQTIAGTFTSTQAIAGTPSDSLLIPHGTTSAKFTLTGADGSNTVKTQKRTTPGGTFADQTTYNSDQASVSVPVVVGEEWRLFQVTQAGTKDVRYKLSAES